MEFNAKDQMKLLGVLCMTFVHNVIFLYEHRQLS